MKSAARASMEVWDRLADVTDATEERAPPGADFDQFVGHVEIGLRRALVAAYGREIGRDAALDALVWAWQHWDRVNGMRNPAGYLYRVGQSSARRELRREQRHRAIRGELLAISDLERDFEPAFAPALAALSPRQRGAVMLVHGHNYSLAEASLVMGCSISSVRNHVDRAMRRLRRALGAPNA